MSDMSLKVNRMKKVPFKDNNLVKGSTIEQYLVKNVCIHCGWKRRWMQDIPT